MDWHPDEMRRRRRGRRNPTRRHEGTEHARRACGPPAFGGPDERGQWTEYKRYLIGRALVFRPLTSFVPRAARRHRPSVTLPSSSFKALLRASSVTPCLRVEFVSVISVTSQEGSLSSELLFSWLRTPAALPAAVRPPRYPDCGCARQGRRSRHAPSASWPACACRVRSG